jgi:hypothetical protein
MFLPHDFAKNFANVNEPLRQEHGSFHIVFGSTFLGGVNQLDERHDSLFYFCIILVA